MKNEIIRLGIILFIITAIAGTLLGIVNQATSKIIEKQIIDSNNLSRKSILNQADEFILLEEDFGDEIIEVYKGLKENKIIGYTIKTSPKGYSGNIEITTGINLDGIISGVSIGTMNETPGLGAKAKEEKFINQFSEKSTNENLEVIKSGKPINNEIQAISGATITSVAVTKGVNISIELFNTKLQ